MPLRIRGIFPSKTATYAVLRRGHSSRAALWTNASNSSPLVQPALLLEHPEKIECIRHLARNNLLDSLLINDREGKLHRLFRRVLFGGMYELHVQALLLVSMNRHLSFLLCEFACKRYILVNIQLCLNYLKK